MPVIIGADPGLTGALCALDTETLALKGHLQMPTLVKGSKKTVNGYAVTDFLRSFDILGVAVENVGPQPANGVAAAFSFGRNTGILVGTFQALKLPMTEVSPAKWKRKMGFISKDKDAPRSAALILYPEIKDLHLKGKGQALADAIFIAKAGLANFTK